MNRQGIKCLWVGLFSISTSPIVLAQKPVPPKVEKKAAGLTENSVVAYFSKSTQVVKNKEQSTYYRVFLKRTASGGYLVQDFYTESDQKRTDPIQLTDEKLLKTFHIQVFEGTLVEWYTNAHKLMELSMHNGVADGRFIKWFDNGQKKSRKKYDNSYVLEETRWYESGQKQYKDFTEDGIRYTRYWDEVDNLTREKTK